MPRDPRVGAKGSNKDVNGQADSNSSNPLADKLAFYLLKKVNKAIRDHQLIAAGDSVAVAVSGGKDSLSLLRLLQARQRSAPERYDLIALHVRDEGQRGDGRDLGLLETWLQQAGVEYHFLEMDVSEDEERPLSCFRCAWHRRKALFLAAQRLGCHKLAFGHHADDLAHTTLLNLFYHGRLETMAPRLAFFGGQIIVIRPLVYVPEKELVRFARACGFPLPPGCCSQAATSPRQRMRELLRAVEQDAPRAKINLVRAVQRCRAAQMNEQLPRCQNPPDVL